MSLLTFPGWQISITYEGVSQLSDLVKNILIRVPKMNEIRLEQHEGE